VVLTGIGSGKPRAVGFVYKNEESNYKRDKYVNTIDEVERITALDFFPALPDKVENAIEATYDLDLWP
jgi:endonuclease G